MALFLLDLGSLKKIKDIYINAKDVLSAWENKTQRNIHALNSKIVNKH